MSSDGFDRYDFAVAVLWTGCVALGLVGVAAIVALIWSAGWPWVLIWPAVLAVYLAVARWVVYPMVRKWW